MLRRRSQRILVVQALFSWEWFQYSYEELSLFLWTTPTVQSEKVKYAQLILHTALREMKRVDSLIVKHLNNWSFERVFPIDKAILRTAVTEMCFSPQDIPSSIVLDEYISIARNFSSEKSFQFINGVLDAISHNTSEVQKETL